MPARPRPPRSIVPANRGGARRRTASPARPTSPSRPGPMPRPRRIAPRARSGPCRTARPPRHRCAGTGRRPGDRHPGNSDPRAPPERRRRRAAPVRRRTRRSRRMTKAWNSQHESRIRVRVLVAGTVGVGRIDRRRSGLAVRRVAVSVRGVVLSRIQRDGDRLHEHALVAGNGQHLARRASHSDVRQWRTCRPTAPSTPWPTP